MLQNLSKISVWIDKLGGLGDFLCVYKWGLKIKGPKERSSSVNLDGDILWVEIVTSHTKRKV